MNYYYTDQDNQARGPVSLSELRALQAAGKLPPFCQVVAQGGVAWQPLSTVLIPVPGSPAISGGQEPLAVIALVMSIVSFPACLLCCLPVFSVAGVVCGHISLLRIKKDPALSGKAMAVWGLVLGYLVIVPMVLFFAFLAGSVVFELWEGAPK